MHDLSVGALIESDLSTLLQSTYSNSKIAILTDSNTQEHCLPHLFNSLDGLDGAEVLQIEAGEESKDLEIAAQLYVVLTEYGFGRKDLIINLGGGVITDLGGFIASTYKRGIQMINIPTTLLGMIDAAIGGKTGVNLNQYKNQIGTFYYPAKTYIDPVFLGTLPKSELLNGFAEALKHGLISDLKLFNRIVANGYLNVGPELLSAIVDVKKKVVENDPLESGPRKVLNFGHTFGHALEGVINQHGHIGHGHAVAIGMMVESHLSLERGLLELTEYEQILNVIRPNFEFPNLSEEELKRIALMLQNDKKNHSGKLMTCLLNGIGNCIYDQEVNAEDFTNAYLKLTSDF